MSATEYTPAPWAARDGYVVAIDYPGRVVARCGDYGEVFGASNARLIAAAPDLLTALVRALPSVCKCGSRDCCETTVRQQAVAAIAKAKGE